MPTNNLRRGDSDQEFVEGPRAPPRNFEQLVAEMRRCRTKARDLLFRKAHAMQRRSQQIFDQLLDAVRRAVADIVDQHGSNPAVVRELQGSFEVLASELTDAPLNEWFRNVAPHARSEIERAVNEVAIENLFDERRSNNSRVIH